MGFSDAEKWWQKWQLRILVLTSLFLQYFLFMSSLLRKRCVPSWVRFFIWLAYLGSDAMAIYALAALFNHNKENSLDVTVLWAPILLVHLGGQDGITAYNIEDNELWKRHVLTAISQVTVAVYVFWKSWSKGKSGNYLAGAILLFVPGILKCILKPWDLKRVSINSLVGSSGSEENGNIRSLEAFVDEAASTGFRPGQLSPGSAQPSEEDVNKIYDLFVDLAPPYSYRLTCLRQLVNDRDKARRLLRFGLSATFSRLYTKESVLHQSFSNILTTLVSNTIDLLRVLAAGCMLAVVVVIPINQGRSRATDTDVRITYILLSCTVALEFIVLVMTLVNRINPWSGDHQLQWPDQVAQYNLIWYLARNQKCKTKTLRKLATLLVCKDYLDQHWCMPSCKSSSNITNLVHDYLKNGWMGENRITDMATYRAFNDNRGRWTLQRENCRTQLEWSIQRPFDESVILWHLATDFCFHLSAPSPNSNSEEAARLSREMSNYMAYLLFVNPEMLMTGARRSLFRAAYKQLKKTLRVIPQQNTLHEENALTQRISRNIIYSENHQLEIRIVRHAWKLAENLKALRLPETDERMWRVIKGVWVEMLCFSAGRCRGYLHAKSLGQGGEYLSYIWLLLSYMGMETLSERMQRTELQQDEERNNGGSASGGTQASTSTPTGGRPNATTEDVEDMDTATRVENVDITVRHI